MTQQYGDCCLFTYVYLTEPRMTDRLLMHTKENYIGQNHGKEEIDLVGQLNEVPTKEDNERLCLILEKAKAKIIGVTKQAPIKDNKKKKMLVL